MMTVADLLRRLEKVNSEATIEIRDWMSIGGTLDRIIVTDEGTVVLCSDRPLVP